jgi:hypothetical protein
MWCGSARVARGVSSETSTPSREASRWLESCSLADAVLECGGIGSVWDDLLWDVGALSLLVSVESELSVPTEVS